MMYVSIGELFGGETLFRIITIADRKDKIFGIFICRELMQQWQYVKFANTPMPIPDCQFSAKYAKCANSVAIN